MRGYVPDFTLETPRNLTHALGLIRDGARPFAGGTDVMVLLEAGVLAQKTFVNLWNLAELKGIRVTPSEVTLGALTTYQEVRSHAVLNREFGCLVNAARETGAIAIQNRGTLGGNIANASPAADSPPALLVYDAQVELTSLRGSRWVPYQEFHSGYKKTCLRPDEIISRVRLPRRFGKYHHHYRKVGGRLAQAISKVCIAAIARARAKKIVDIRIALGSVAPIPLRAVRVEDFLRGRSLESSVFHEASRILDAEISPIDDIRSTAVYRKRVAGNCLVQFLEELG